MLDVLRADVELANRLLTENGYNIVGEGELDTPGQPLGVQVIGGNQGSKLSTATKSRHSGAAVRISSDKGTWEVSHDEMRTDGPLPMGPLLSLPQAEMMVG